MAATMVSGVDIVVSGWVPRHHGVRGSALGWGVAGGDGR
jgi:hypothetical protein